jgi:ATP-dependent Clp protease ATP-binding subunit ClpA
MSQDREHPRIESLDEQKLEARLREAARDLAPDRAVDDLELRHLIRVISECSLLFHDVYAEERIARIMQPHGSLLDSLVRRLLERHLETETAVRRFRRLPDEARRIGDKALFDLGLLGLRQVKGYDLERLGARAYRLAGEALELLAEDRRLRELFKQNRLLMLPIEEEVVFLQQCSENIRLYADILQRTHGVAPTLDDVAARVPLMAAAAEALERRAAEVAEDDAPAEGDPYQAAARGQVAPAEAHSKERALAAWERVLLFSALDMDRLRDALEATVVDQPQAIRALCDEVSLFAAGTRDPRKPPAYFLVGPTGVGKNYLVESLGRLLEGVWGVEVPTLTIEGPSYTYPSDINELRGATRGFIRSDEEGLLTSFHRRSAEAPLGIILVDEVEKAHPQLRTFFLSILDRGTTTDNRGAVLDFANCMIFFTSNLGYSDSQLAASPIGYTDADDRQRATDSVIRKDVRRGLSPEFANRVRMVHFDRLGRGSAERILDLELAKIDRRYREVHGLSLRLDDTAREELIRRGFSPDYGARHLASVLESQCNVGIARKIRRDAAGDPGDRQGLIRWLREMREGTRPYRPEEVRDRVLEFTRARLGYDGLTIAFTDGRFDYEPFGDGSGGAAGGDS